MCKTYRVRNTFGRGNPTRLRSCGFCISSHFVHPSQLGRPLFLRSAGQTALTYCEALHMLSVWSASHGQTVSTPRNPWVAASAWLMLQCDLQIHVPGKPIVQSHQRNPSVGAMKPWWYLGTTLYVLPALLMQTTSTRGHGHSGGCDCMVWSPKQKVQPFYALKRYLSKSKIVFPAGALIWKLKLCLWPQPSRWFGKCPPLPLQISDGKHYLATWPR